MALALACFDFDNTLIDRQGAYLSWARAFVAARDLDPGALELLVALDRDGFASRAEVFAPAQEALGLAESVDELIGAYRVAYLDHIAPVPEVARALARLRAAGVRTALVTNGPPSQADKLARAGLCDSFDAVCISELIGARKPDRAIFAVAAQRCGLRLDELAGRGVMVGDHPIADIAGGRAAGLRTVWIRRGRSWEDPGSPPDVTVDGPLEAVAALLVHVAGEAG
jgi:putative hydrolase of the HAD superfamily